MTMIVAVANTKGGVGKTTLALNLAIQRSLNGRDVWLVDGDRQATAATAIAVRSESGRLPAIACSSYPDGAQLRSQVLLQRGKFEEVIIDVGGRDSSALRAALIITDIVLIPFQPRSYDVWALNDIAQLVGEAQAIRDGLRAYAVLNFADPAGGDNRAAADAVSEFPALTFLDAPLHRRKAFANAAGAGLSVTELKPADAKANAELKDLMRHLYVTDSSPKMSEQSVMTGEESVT